MPSRRLRIGLLAAAGAMLWLAPAASADTCCASAPVTFEPETAMPGDTVALRGIRCLAADGSGPMPLLLGGFWLATDEWDWEADTTCPDCTPGPEPPVSGFPPSERWPAFDTVPDPTTAAGTATITVPTSLASGMYQLWWWCDEGTGPGGGIHFSSGARLRIGSGIPDTATASTIPPGADASDAGGSLAFLLAAAGAFALAFRRARRLAAWRARWDSNPRPED